MIAKLKGIVDSISGNSVIIDTNGVGYEVHATRACLAAISAGQAAQLIIYTEIKEDAIKLYAFEDELEKQVFLLLMQVKGIGAKTAADIISKIDKFSFLRFISEANLTALQSVKGLGKKTAERIIFELKDRIGDYVVEKRSSGGLEIELEREEPANEALEALLSLGFQRKEAERAISRVDLSPEILRKGSGEIVKQALRYF